MSSPPFVSVFCCWSLLPFHLLPVTFAWYHLAMVTPPSSEIYIIHCYGPCSTFPSTKLRFFFFFNHLPPSCTIRDYCFVLFFKCCVSIIQPPFFFFSYWMGNVQLTKYWLSSCRKQKRISDYNFMQGGSTRILRCKPLYERARIKKDNCIPESHCVLSVMETFMNNPSQQLQNNFPIFRLRDRETCARTRSVTDAHFHYDVRYAVSTLASGRVRQRIGPSDMGFFKRLYIGGRPI